MAQTVEHYNGEIIFKTRLVLTYIHIAYKQFEVLVDYKLTESRTP